ncbi:SIR2 family protein [Jonesiaceae bacterium BS-20]|uniref:SIR2 family protein n=1 Tax=Jonesiaceae bacterium BS-20 TaxID=3120821 RepID=A0AAU7E0T5_9MICO
MPAPLLTTNYDTLVSSRTRSPVGIEEVQRFQQIFTRPRGDVGHLHGIWTDSNSIIFSNKDYQSTLDNGTSQTLLKALLFQKSLVFVGFGAGLSDPNFSQLLGWYAEHFPNPAFPSFRLCLDSEVEALTQETPTLIAHPYGSNYSDLTNFLKFLSTQFLDHQEITARRISPSYLTVRNSIEHELINDSILMDRLDRDENLAFADVICPPVLLPVPHDEYVRAQRSRKDEDRVNRVDHSALVSGAEVLVVVGDESAGLTTAVKWIMLRASENLDETFPLYISYKSAQSRGLQAQVRASALQSGLIERRLDSLPPHVLAVDDFSPFSIDRAHSDSQFLTETDAIVIVIGCRPRAEERITQLFRDAGKTTETVYLGKLASEDIEQYAKLAHRGNYRTLSKLARETLETENLPRMLNSACWNSYSG